MTKKQNADEWNPKTKLGKEVAQGKINSVDEIFKEGRRIMEPEIVDLLLPRTEHELILIGGSPGKGGGMRRTPAKRTAKMHKSGRKYKMTAYVVVGNSDGYAGVGKGKGTGSGAFRTAIQKAIKKAKMNTIPVTRGCGSWECECGSHHSIPSAVEGKKGSVEVVLKPAPRGVGLVAPDEVKKILELAGIEDCWTKTSGETRTRMNLIGAVFRALKKLNELKLKDEFKEKTGVVRGAS